MSAWRSTLFILPILMAVILAGCGKPGNVRTPGSSQSKAKPQRSKVRVVTSGVKELTWQAGGQYIMRAKAGQLIADEETGKANLKDGRAIMFKDGKESAVMSAKLIEADTHASTLVASGGITVRSLVRNAQISAKTATWWRKQDRISGEGGVVLTSGAGRILADRMEAETALKQVTLYSDKGGRASVNVSQVGRPQ